MTDIKEKGFVAIWKDMPARFSRFIWKLFSVKVFIMAGCFGLVIFDKLDGWNAVALIGLMGLIVIFDRDAIKFIEAMKGLK